MITIQTAFSIADGFKNEVCELLNLDSSKVQLTLISQHASMKNVVFWEHIGVQLIEDKVIGVSADFLRKCISEVSFTPLRFNIYTNVCIIWKEKQDDYVNFLREATIYASALMLIKGLSIPYIPMFAKNQEEYFKPILLFLKQQFQLEGKMFRLPGKEEYYKIRLTGISALTEKMKYNTPLLIPAVPVLADSQKGSIDNPFDTIDDAIDYVKELEKQLYEKDVLLQSIANQQYYYDFVQGQFRITWASPHVAHVKNMFPKKSFVLSQMNTGYFSLKPNLYGRKFLLRGQNDYYDGIPCVPNLFRNKDHNDKRYYLDFLIFSQEMELLIKSHPLVQLLESGVELLHDKFAIRMNYQGLAQHYYNKSHFLDLTSDFDAMKFFATTSYDSASDTYRPFTEKGKIGVLYLYDLQFPMAFQQHKGYALKAIGKQVFMRSGAQSGFLLEMERGVDFKTLPEVSSVYFRHDAAIARDFFEKCHHGHDFFANDLLSHAWKDRFQKRSLNKVVSKEAVKLNVKINLGETVNSVTKKLVSLGIAVDDFKPCFSQEEMDMYYQSIKDGWWEQFCDDIYFNSPDGELYRDALKNIPNVPQYKWAFER